MSVTWPSVWETDGSTQNHKFPFEHKSKIHGETPTLRITENKRDKTTPRLAYNQII